MRRNECRYYVMARVGIRKAHYLQLPFYSVHFCLDAKVEQKIKPVFDDAKN